jgi:hypothetical protein
VDDRYHLPVRPYPRIYRWLLRWLQRKCQHNALKADILEGCSKDYSVRWCETCGGFAIVVGGTPCPVRMPEPTWEPKNEWS